MKRSWKLRRSIRQEKRVARETGGRRVAGSGSMPGNKGDVRADKNWLVEAKTTSVVSYNLKLSVWRKIEKEAFSQCKLPMLQLDIGGRRLAIIDYQTWLELRPLLTAD